MIITQHVRKKNLIRIIYKSFISKTVENADNDLYNIASADFYHSYSVENKHYMLLVEKKTYNLLCKITDLRMIFSFPMWTLTLPPLRMWVGCFIPDSLFLLGGGVNENDVSHVLQ